MAEASSGHSAHFGARAVQRARPWWMIWCEKSIHLACGITFIRSCSMCFGSSERVNSSRRAMRCTWVSTTIPSPRPNQEPSTTLAVLRATPGSVSNSSIVSGTRPPNCCITLRAAPTMFFALLRKKPVERISGSNSSGSIAASDAASGNLRNSAGVTKFTLTSVHCAERRVATSNCQAFSR